MFENEFSAAFFNSAWRQFRKRNAYPTAITQNVEYLLDSVQASTMLSNSEFIVMLNQAASDREKLARLLNISTEQMGYITNAAVDRDTAFQYNGSRGRRPHFPPKIPQKTGGNQKLPPDGNRKWFTGRLRIT